jgi:uncharacterized protein HemY
LRNGKALEYSNADQKLTQKAKHLLDEGRDREENERLRDFDKNVPRAALTLVTSIINKCIQNRAIAE